MKITRRKLLKGSLAAPLLLTVQSGGANAAQSAGLCTVRDQRRSNEWPRPAELTRVDVDDWLRINVDMCALYRQQGSGGLERIDGKFFLGVDRMYYWRLDERDPNALRASKTNYTVSSVTAQRTGEIKHALVYIGYDGQPTGYAMERQGGNPITQSCWQSIKVGRLPRWWG